MIYRVKYWRGKIQSVKTTNLRISIIYKPKVQKYSNIWKSGYISVKTTSKFQGSDNGGGSSNYWLIPPYVTSKSILNKLTNKAIQTKESTWTFIPLINQPYGKSSQN